MRDYLAMMGDMTRVNYGYILNDFLNFYKSRSYESIKMLDVERFLVLPPVGRKRKCSNNYFNFKLSVLRSFFNYLIHRDVLIKNPCHFIKSKVVGRGRSERSLSEEEVRYILRRLTGDARDACFIMYWSGVRIGELASLRRSNFKVMNIGGESKFYISVMGKGFVSRGIVVRDEVIKCCFDRFNAYSYLSDTPLFPSKVNVGSCMTRRGLYKKIKKQLRDYGFGRVTPHWFRHGCAQRMQRAGFTTDVISQSLGHSNLAATQRYLRGLGIVDVR